MIKTGTLYIRETPGGPFVEATFDNPATIAYGPVTAEQTFGTTNNNGAAVTAARSDHAHGNPAHTPATHSTISLTALAAPISDLSLGGHRAVNALDPLVATDLATKGYTDNLVAGLAWKDAVRLATTANITLSGTQTIDGVAAVAGNRVLVKNQTTAAQNGIYVAAAGTWTRATDADSAADIENMAMFVMEGATLADTGWVCTVNAPITVGTTALTFTQFPSSGGTSYVAGAGLTLTGSTFDVVAANGSLTVAADSVQVAYAGTGSAVTAARSDHLHTGVYSPVSHTHTGGGTDEVWISTSAPTDTAIELWYNPTAVPTTSSASVPIVVKATEPTAADYGQATIPVNAIWVVKP